MDRQIVIPWLDALPIPVLVLRADRVAAVNQHAARLLAQGPERCLGRTLASLFAEAGTLDDLPASDEHTSLADLPLAPPGEGTVDLVIAPPSRAIASDARVVALLDTRLRQAQGAELARLRDALAESERARSRMETVQRELIQPEAPVRLVGASAPMLSMLDQVERVAPSNATVLIHGESGSGKELVARAIHEGSGRAQRAWVALNCAALPETLLESELFGHERGAFTGADRRRLGKFELADGGTLFLDEIAELSPAAQAKLLRVLQDGTFARVGGAETIGVDVRLIAATHRDLAEQVRRGRFREDLFYRLNVFRIEVPALRERKEDIRALAEFFHERHARRMARPILQLSERSVRRLLAYRWPGNVRELENTIERATLLSTGAFLEVELPEAPITGSAETSARADTSSVPRDVLLDLTLDQLQRLQIMHALETSRYRVFGEGGAAEKLAIHPQTLLSRMDKLGIPRPRAMRSGLSGGSG